MLDINTSSYPDYTYCTLSEARLHRKDAKLQFVVLIASKPEVTKPKELRWKVVDRSGKSNENPSTNNTRFSKQFLLPLARVH